MSNTAKTVGISSVLGIVFLLQFSLAFYMPGILFFPAAALYAASFLRAWSSLFIGLVVGSMFDGLSPFPFGVYTLGIVGGMLCISVSMQFVNERQVGARSVVVFAILGVYALYWALLYSVLGYTFDMLILHFWDMISIAVSILLITVGHVFITMTLKRT